VPADKGSLLNSIFGLVPSDDDTYRHLPFRAVAGIRGGFGYHAA
jgi:hypothetical protein